MKYNSLALGLMLICSSSFAEFVPLCYQKQCVKINPETLAVTTKNGISLSAPQNIKSVKQLGHATDHLSFERDKLKVTVDMTKQGFRIRFVPIIKLNKQQQLKTV